MFLMKNRFEKGAMTLGAGLLGAVLTALPTLAQNVFGSLEKQPPQPTQEKILSPEDLKRENTILRDEIKNLQTELTRSKLEAIFIRDTLKLGDRGSDVKGLQLFLSAIPDTFEGGELSETFGKTTEKSLKTFQEREGLSATGRMDKDTRDKIFNLVITSEINAEMAKISDLMKATSTPVPASTTEAH